jgi:hypothetical protein
MENNDILYIPSAFGNNGIACGTSSSDSSSEISIAILLMPSDKKTLGMFNTERRGSLPSLVLVTLSYVIKRQKRLRKRYLCSSFSKNIEQSKMKGYFLLQCQNF